MKRLIEVDKMLTTPSCFVHANLSSIVRPRTVRQEEKKRTIRDELDILMRCLRVLWLSNQVLEVKILEPVSNSNRMG